MKISKLWMWVLVLLGSWQAYGQQYSTTILYNISVPVGNTTDYLNAISFRGLTVSPRIYLSDAFSLGVSAGWQVFYEKRQPATYEQGENLTLFGTQFRYINAFPLQLSPHVHFAPKAKFKPYAGVDLGTTYFIQNTNMGLFAIREQEWMLGLSPEVGVMFPFKNDWHFTLSGKYNHLFAAGELPAQGYAAINLGLTHFFRGYRY